jgi:hypothetical protein
MNFEQRPTGSLRPYSGNARTHSPKQIKQIARSIERFGFNNPVLIDAFWPEEHFVVQSLKGDRNHLECAAISPPHCSMIRPVLGSRLF